MEIIYSKLFIFALLTYFLLVSIIGFVLPPVDKKRAKRGEWRIPEKTLFAVSILGGGLSMLVSMKIFRHKTQHKRFMIGIPIIIVLHVVGLLALYILPLI